MAATMRDVAKAAGVSTATVSFVVNGTKPVTAATRRRVEQAMDDLGFRRNVVARALASKRTRIIALACPFLPDRSAYSVKDFFIGAAQAAREADHHLVIWPVGHDRDEVAALAAQGLVDGVVLMEVRLDDVRVGVLKKMGMPFALIGRTRTMTGLNYVDIDFDASMQAAVHHLAALGHERIAFINGSEESDELAGFGPYVRTEEAYRKLVADRGLPAIVASCVPTVHGGRRAADDLLSSAAGATAVIVLEEAVASGVVAELTRQGRRIPQDISVMSVLSSVDAAAVSNPPLTTVTVPGAELGRLGVAALLRQLNGDTEPSALLRGGELQPGESTGAVPGGRRPSR